MNVIYYIVISQMFRTLMCPSSGLREQSYKYSYDVKILHLVNHFVDLAAEMYLSYSLTIAL